jgi:hypothetical protein
LAWLSGQHGRVSDLLWDDVRNFFDPDLTGRPDVWVADTSVDDWQALLDLVGDSDWKSEYSVGDVVVPLPRAEQVLSRLPIPSARVCTSGRLPMCWRSSGSCRKTRSISMSICGSYRRQERLDLLCGLFAAIGRRLGKSVLMWSEGDWEQEHPVL